MAKFGSIDSCRFVQGYFSESLPDLDVDSVVLIFEDADLKNSVEDCLKHLWPKLQEGCRFYCDEPWAIAVVGLFYDEEWWGSNLNSKPPGSFGSGKGVVAGLHHSSIGYAVKFDAENRKISGQKIMHAGSRGFEGRLHD